MTEKGKKAKENIFKTDMELREKITENITREELETTFKTLEKMNKNLRDKVKLQT